MRGPPAAWCGAGLCRTVDPCASAAAPRALASCWNGHRGEKCGGSGMTALANVSVNAHPSWEREYNVERIRADFPILHQKVHGHPLVYLDNAATSQKPRQVIDAITRYYERDNANIHRGVHYLSEKATEDYENARKAVQEFINAGDSREIIFVRSTTEAINLVAQTYARQNLKPGDEVLITAMEHHSDIVPWQMICQEKQGKLQVAPINEDGELILEEFERLLTPRTKLVAVAHLSNALGTINPIKRIVEIAHAKKVAVLVDGAQA